MERVTNIAPIIVGALGRGIKETIKDVDSILGRNASHTTIITSMQKAMHSESKKFIIEYLLINISSVVDER